MCKFSGLTGLSLDVCREGVNEVLYFANVLDKTTVSSIYNIHEDALLHSNERSISNQEIPQRMRIFFSQEKCTEIENEGETGSVLASLVLEDSQSKRRNSRQHKGMYSTYLAATMKWDIG